jgi:hypothetical protein
MKLLAALTLLLICQQITHAQANVAAGGNGDLIEVTAFAVRFEAEASQLKARKDLCVAIDTRLEMREKDLVSKLKASGLAVHSHEWCNRGPRGLRFLVSAPIKRADDGAYEVKVEVGDLTIKTGEHFATMLKQGTYRVRFEKGSQPEMGSYHKTCCPRTE